MALDRICTKGHKYMQPDIIVGDWPEGMPACPECAKEWLAEREIRDVQRISVKPGDVIVVRYDLHLAPGELEKVLREMARVFPHNNALVMDQGPSIVVLGAEG